MASRVRSRGPALNRTVAHLTPIQSQSLPEGPRPLEGQSARCRADVEPVEDRQPDLLVLLGALAPGFAACITRGDRAPHRIAGGNTDPRVGCPVTPVGHPRE